MVVAFPPGVDNWRGVPLDMQPLQAHTNINIAYVIAAVAAVVLVAVLVRWLTSPTQEDRAERRERAWYPEF